MRLLVFLILMFLVAILFIVLGKANKVKFVSILGIIVALDVIGCIVVNMYFWYRDTSVSVIGMDGKEFVVQIDNHEDRYKKSDSYFATKYTMDELTEQFKQQHGQVSKLEDGIQIVEGENSYSLREIRQENALTEMRYQYRLRADFVELPDLKRGNQCVKVVFPMAAIPEYTSISKEMNCDWDMGRLKAYYTNLPNAKVLDDSIEIDGVRIKIEDHKVFFKSIT